MPSCGPPTARSRASSPQVQGTDQMAGFAVDTELPILWAREPGTGATLATYVNVPTHVDQYNPINAPEHQFSADYPGWVRDRLADTLGGTSVIAAGTLGRQESIGADSTYDEVAQQGRFITNQVMRALTQRPSHHRHHARRGDAVVLDPGRRTPGLLAGDVLQPPRWPARLPGRLHGARRQQRRRAPGTWSPVGGIFTINRSLSAPWFAGRPACDRHVGDRRPRRRSGLRHRPGRGVPGGHRAPSSARSPDADGIRGAHIIDHAGDQLGYYWDQRPGIYPPAQLAQSDFAKFNVGLAPRAGQRRRASAPPARRSGLAPTAQHAYAEIDNPNAFSEPTIQFYSNRVETDDPAVSFYATAKKAQAAGSPSTSIGSTAAHPERRQGRLGLRRRHGRDAQPTRPASRTRSRGRARTACRRASPTTSARRTAGRRR